jgi:hypothetical protein
MIIDFCADTVTMARELDPFRIPRAGLETIPLAGLATLPLLGGQANLGPRQLISEATLAGVLVYAAYQTLLSGLRTEAMVRRGELGRAGQVALIGRSVWASMKEGTAVSLVLSLVLLVCPWLAMPMAVLGVVGLGKASLDLFHAFWDGLSPEQRLHLHAAAYEAGVNLNRLVSREADPRLES